MSWTIALRPDGAFDVSNQVHARLFSGAFGAEISVANRLRLLNLVAEAEAMRSMLGGILGEFDGLLYQIEQDQGAEAAKKNAAGLYEMRRLIAGQIRRADGLEDEL